MQNCAPLFIISPLSFDVRLFSSHSSACRRILFAPLDKGAFVSLTHAFHLWGYEEFWGAGGNSENSPCRFRFLLRSKGRLAFFAPFASFGTQRKAFVFDMGHSVKVLVVFKHARSICSACSNTLYQASRLGGELEFPLLPFGLSSPVSERASLLLKCGTNFPPLEKRFGYRIA